VTEERRVVTILFADVVGSTALGEVEPTTSANRMVTTRRSSVTGQ